MKNFNSPRFCFFLIALFCSLFSVSSFSQMTPLEAKKFIQNASESELVTENSTYLMEGYLYISDLIANKLIEINPSSWNYQYRKGFTPLMVHHDYLDPIPRFEQAITKINKNNLKRKFLRRQKCQQKKTTF